MNKLAYSIKLALMVSTLATLPFANATNKNSTVSKEEGKAFIESSNISQKELVDTTNLAWYIKDRFTTLDTENHVANLLQKGEKLNLQLAYETIQYRNSKLNNDLIRRLKGIMSSAYLYSGHPYPQDENKVTQLKEVIKELTEVYAKNTACFAENETMETCLDAKQVTEKMANSLNEVDLKELWVNWHNSLVPLKPLYQQQVHLNNDGAQRFGFSNRVEMQLSQFEMPAEELIEQLDNVWNEIEPLYRSLHRYVRNELMKKYGEDVVKPNQPIPAHLLGKLSVNDLSNIYDLIKPEGAVIDRGYNIAEKLKQYPEIDVPTLLHGQEDYMVSLGFAPFKKSLYEVSQFTKPEHYKAACDSTSWWLPENKEARVGGCWEVDENTFMRFNTTSLLTPTYFRAAHDNQPGHYSAWPVGTTSAVFRAFQYAYTPDYLQAIDMLDETPDNSADLGYLMKLALSTISAMPYKLAIIKWQKEVAAGEIDPINYNKRWWQLREYYQGIAAPVDRNANSFDAGAESTIIHNQDQINSLITEIIGFQFYQSLCETSGNKNILSRCSFYGSKDVGKKLQAMFELGSSQPWYKTMSKITGNSKLNGKAIIEYFEPLQEYLDQQNLN